MIVGGWKLFITNKFGLVSIVFTDRGQHVKRSELLARAQNVQRQVFSKISQIAVEQCRKFT